MSTILFYALAGVVVAAAFLTLTVRNLFHCALFLAMTMFGISGVFIYLHAEFLAIVQVLIYVGAVTVLIIFGIMLTRHVMDAHTRVMNHQVAWAVAAALLFTGVVFKALDQSPFQGANQPLAAVSATAPSADSTAGSYNAGDVEALGPELLRPEHGFAFAFEFVSILLLSALVGATVIARKDPE